MSADVTVRCHRCARPFEVFVYPDEVEGGDYTVPAGMSPSCPHCGHRHPSGLEDAARGGRLMPCRHPVPREVTELRRRLRKFSGADLDRIAAFAGLPRSTVYAVRSAKTRVPKPGTVKALTGTLEHLAWPLPKARRLGLRPFDDHEEAQAWAAEVFEVCDRYAYETIRCGVDLDDQATDAVFALRRGETLKKVLSCVKDEDAQGEPARHPAADKVRAELRRLYEHVFGGTGRPAGRPERGTSAALSP